MLKLIKFIIGIIIIAFRCGIIVKMVIELYSSYKNPSNLLNESQWYICAMIFDLYLINLEKHLSSDIYIKNENE